MPRGLRNLGAYELRYQAQTYGYVYLLTERYPYSGPAAGWQMTLAPDTRRHRKRPDPIPEVDRAGRRDRGGLDRGRLAAVADGGARQPAAPGPRPARVLRRPPSSRRPRTTSASPRSTRSCRRSCWSSCWRCTRATASASRASPPPAGSARGCCSGMLGFAFVWFAQLPVRARPAVVGPPPRRVGGRLHRLRRDELARRSGGVFLFVCVAIVDRDGAGAPVPRPVVDPRARPCSSASACCSRSSRPYLVPDQAPLRNRPPGAGGGPARAQSRACPTSR